MIEQLWEGIPTVFSVYKFVKGHDLRPGLVHFLDWVWPIQIQAIILWINLIGICHWFLEKIKKVHNAKLSETQIQNLSNFVLCSQRVHAHKIV